MSRERLFGFTPDFLSHESAHSLLLYLLTPFLPLPVLPPLAPCVTSVGSYKLFQSLSAQKLGFCASSIYQPVGVSPQVQVLFLDALNINDRVNFLKVIDLVTS